MQQRNRRPCPWRVAHALGPRRRVHCPPIADDRPKRLVRRYYEDVLERRQMGVLHRLVGRDFLGHDSGGAMMDRTDYITAVEMLHNGFDQLVVTVEDQIAEGDLVTTRWSAIGRHTGPFAGIAPAGARVAVSHMHFFRYRGARLADLWHVWDTGILMRQLTG